METRVTLFLEDKFQRGDAPLLLFWLWRHCKVYWNGKFQTSGLNRKSCKVKFLTKYLQWIGTIHRVHKKFHLNCIRLKHSRDWWDNGQIQIFAAQWLMGHFCKWICQSVCLILKSKIHTGSRTIVMKEAGNEILSNWKISNYSLKSIVRFTVQTQKYNN